MGQTHQHKCTQTDSVDITLHQLTHHTHQLTIDTYELTERGAQNPGRRDCGVISLFYITPTHILSRTASMLR